MQLRNECLFWNDQHKLVYLVSESQARKSRKIQQDLEWIYSADQEIYAHVTSKEGYEFYSSQYEKYYAN